MSRSLDRRRDVRTEKQFKQDILEGSKRERTLINIWSTEMVRRGHNIIIKDNGIDNSGQFVEKSDNRPDYLVTIDGNTALYEVKSNKAAHRNSFKRHDLKSYLKCGANILLFYNIGENYQHPSYDTMISIINPNQIEEILKLPSTSRDRTWGNKEIVIVWARDFDRYFVSERLFSNGLHA